MATRMDGKVEKMSKMIHLILTKFTVKGVVVPALISTVFNCFINDFNDESYVLPFPIMYVK